MKELTNSQPIGDILNTHYPIRRLRGKTWKTAQHRGSNPAQVRQNECVEFSYNEVLNLVKTHYMKSGELYFEKDMRQDRTQFLAMHSFITPTFYWNLECAAYYDYEIEFAFHDCPFEAEVRKLFRAFPLDRQTKQKEVKHYPLFYKAVMLMLDPQFIFFFKR